MSEKDVIDWEVNQLVKTRLFVDEKDVLRSALRALFQTQPGIKRQMIISAYTTGEISLGKAAELLGCSHEEMKDILRENGVSIHFGPETTENLLQDADNA